MDKLTPPPREKSQCHRPYLVSKVASNHDRLLLTSVAYVMGSNSGATQCRFKLISGPGCRRCACPLGFGGSKFITRKSG
ncbi:hypothetical protein TNCV_3072941 [Trichonephila clavipes]|nr:hypothetical protein TNCV_3072941 [Trichonephila clavipes]